MTKRSFVWILLVMLVLLAVPRCQRFLEIDRCLDAGGRWLEDSRACEGLETALPAPH